MLLSYSMFSLQPEEVQYLVAKEGDTIVGAIGYTYDTVGKAGRILELIDLNDAVGGFLFHLTWATCNWCRRWKRSTIPSYVVSSRISVYTPYDRCHYLSPNSSADRRV